MGDLRRGLAVLAIGGVAIVVVQRVAPLLPPPLYDGVVIVEPYRWLVPPAGQPGNPTSASGAATLERGASPVVALATTEQPPQAQIFAAPTTLVLPTGTSSIAMSITPILPRTLPTDGHIAGNVYRISVTNQVGMGLTAPASGRVSVVLRGPDNEPDVTIEQLTFQGWRPLKTDSAGFGSTYLAVVTTFGDFALVAPGPGGPYPTATAEAGASDSAAASGSPGASSAASATMAASSYPTESLTPSSSPAPSPAGQAGPPNAGLAAAVAAVIALLILGAIGLRGRSERARRRQRSRGARPRRR